MWQDFHGWKKKIILAAWFQNHTRCLVSKHIPRAQRWECGFSRSTVRPLWRQNTLPRYQQHLCFSLPQEKRSMHLKTERLHRILHKLVHQLKKLPHQGSSRSHGCLSHHLAHEVVALSGYEIKIAAGQHECPPCYKFCLQIPIESLGSTSSAKVFLVKVFTKICILISTLQVSGLRILGKEIARWKKKKNF